MSENSSLLSGEDGTSERVRFDDNVSFIDDNSESIVDSSSIMGGASVSASGVGEQQQQTQTTQMPRLLKVRTHILMIKVGM